MHLNIKNNKTVKPFLRVTKPSLKYYIDEIIMVSTAPAEFNMNNRSKMDIQLC